MKNKTILFFITLCLVSCGQNNSQPTNPQSPLHSVNESTDIIQSSDQIKENPISSLDNLYVLDEKTIIDIKTKYLEKYNSENIYSYDEISIDYFYTKFDDKYILRFSGINHDNHNYSPRAYSELNGRIIYFDDENQIMVFEKGELYNVEDVVLTSSQKNIIINLHQELQNKIQQDIFENIAKLYSFNELDNLNILLFLGSFNNSYIFVASSKEKIFEDTHQSSVGSLNLKLSSYCTEILYYNQENLLTLKDAYESKYVSDKEIDYISNKINDSYSKICDDEAILEKIKKAYYSESDMKYANIEFSFIANSGYVFFIAKPYASLPGTKYEIVDGVDFFYNEYGREIYTIHENELITLSKAYELKLITKEELLQMRYLRSGY